MKKLICVALVYCMVASTAFAYEGLEPKPLSAEEKAAAAELGITDSELYQVSEPMTRWERRRIENQLGDEAQDMDKLAEKTDRSIEGMVRYAAWALKRKGYDADADQLVNEYNGFYTHAVVNYHDGIVPVDLGDHKPIWEWLATWYDKIEAKLGVKLCQILHLQDLKVLNFGIPVVFRPKKAEQWCLETTDKPCQDEYRLHFAGQMTGKWSWEYHGVLNVAAYWTTWGVCVAATFGAGAIGFICGPIGTVVEMGVGKYVSPKASDFVFCKVNKDC